MNLDIVQFWHVCYFHCKDCCIKRQYKIPYSILSEPVQVTMKLLNEASSTISSDHSMRSAFYTQNKPSAVNCTNFTCFQLTDGVLHGDA